MAYGPPVPLSGMQLHLQRRNMSFINDSRALNLGGFIESQVVRTQVMVISLVMVTLCIPN